MSASFDESTAERIEQWIEVERLLPGVICSRCDATCADYSEKCSAPADEPCPGFLAVEGAYQHIETMRAI